MYDVKNVRYLNGYKLEVTFEDNAKGVVDFHNHIKRGGIFARLTDQSYFRQVYVNKDLGTLCWPNGEDIAPETLYTLATGQALPDWMKAEATIIK
jgi:hypothetical protein